MNIFRSIDENAGKDNKIANKIQGGGHVAQITLYKNASYLR